jgi:S-methylmethionine-dependent homocysteine/selenocysteine methylase
MGRYPHALPQTQGNLFLTDGGIETTLIFHEGLNLPYFAAFDLLKSEDGTEVLRKYFRSHASVARRHGVGFILESATWRASADWARKLDYSDRALACVNRQAIRLLCDIRDEFESESTEMVVSGCIGPRGDGYKPGTLMSEAEAEQYHATQAGIFGETDADMVTAITMTYAEEAIGLTRAARTAGLPVAVSFTTETNGRLPSGQTLRDAIEQVDDATNRAPAYYMINCAHPTHFEGALREGERWTERIRGLRANASTKSHAELDESTELDEGNPTEFGRQYQVLRQLHPQLSVLGGCCGTDERHIRAICEACVPN